MKYLLTLNRFEIDKARLTAKIGNFYEDYGIVIDKINFKDKDVNEIDKIYVMGNDWKRLDFIIFNEDVLKAFKLVNGDSFFARTKFFDKIPISSKSIVKKINSLMKKENLGYKENGAIEFFVQFKKEKDIYYRVLVRENTSKGTIGGINNITIILDNPGSVIEISDFLRICWIFKLPLMITTSNSNKFQYLLNKAKKMTKGIPYEKFNLAISAKVPDDYIKVGFSIKASLNEKDLAKILQNKKLALIFGDEKFGLPQKVRDECNYLVRLTPESKKPLRSSHALSYVMGFYVRTL